MIVVNQVDLSRASMQDVFDYVVFALIQQGPSYVDGIGCCYRSPEGLRCAIGHIISDVDYRADFEAKSARGLMDVLPPLATWVQAGLDRLEFLTDLQRAHDDAASKDGWDCFRKTASYVARKHNLDASILAYREGQSESGADVLSNTGR